MRVELVYEGSCPNIAAARTQLLRAFAAAGLAPRWQEWELHSGDAPERVRGYGSPTILVDGRDVSGLPAGEADCCRVYAREDGRYQGVPSQADIVHALRGALCSPDLPKAPWRLNGALLPAVGAAFLPKLACPACWPAYTGLLGAMGVGFVDYTPYLLPLTAGFLLIALAALGYRARGRRGYVPLLLGLVASAAIVIDRFQYESDIALYAGLALLIGASLWNTWPRAPTAGSPCPACPPDTRSSS